MHYDYLGKKSFGDYLKYGLVCFFPTERAEIDIRYFYLNGKVKGYLLDVGCGSGDMMKCLSPKEWQVEGCDFDEGAVKQCQRTGIDAKQGDIYEGNYASESFDVVTLNHVIEHLYRTEDVLKECLRILKPGGRLVMATPNGQSRLFKRFGGSWISYVPAHIQIFNVDNLSEVLSKTEFIISEISNHLPQ